jgi:carboxypeptidase Taq
VPNDAHGVLQDVHWSTGYIGSFPTYTIGNVMGAQMMESLSRQKPSLDAAIAAGEYSALAEELRSRIWQHGRRFTRDELLKRETGRRLDPAPYLAYLYTKYVE